MGLEGDNMLEDFDTMRITACKAEDDYKLWLRFEDGLEGRVFLGNLLESGRTRTSFSSARSATLKPLKSP